jgi:hypothetical protein
MIAKLNQVTNFATCLNNEGYQASLEVGKIYQIINDNDAELNGLIRIVDESGEDYAFLQTVCFYPIDLSKLVEEILLATHWFP